MIEDTVRIGALLDTLPIENGARFGHTALIGVHRAIEVIIDTALKSGTSCFSGHQVYLGDAFLSGLIGNMVLISVIGNLGLKPCLLGSFKVCL